MNIHTVFNGVDDATKVALEAYWEKKLPKLEKLLVPYKTDLQDVRLTVSHHRQNPQRSWYEVSTVIHLPTGTLAATDDADDPHAALDRVVDRIVAELKRHKDHVRQEHLFQRHPRGRGERGEAGYVPEPPTA